MRAKEGHTRGVDRTGLHENPLVVGFGNSVCGNKMGMLWVSQYRVACHSVPTTFPCFVLGTFWGRGCDTNSVKVPLRSVSIVADRICTITEVALRTSITGVEAVCVHSNGAKSRSHVLNKN
jgi:hypothetical protein